MNFIKKRLKEIKFYHIVISILAGLTWYLFFESFIDLPSFVLTMSILFILLLAQPEIVKFLNKK